MLFRSLLRMTNRPLWVVVVPCHQEDHPQHCHRGIPGIHGIGVTVMAAITSSTTSLVAATEAEAGKEAMEIGTTTVAVMVVGSTTMTTGERSVKNKTEEDEE